MKLVMPWCLAPGGVGPRGDEDVGGDVHAGREVFGAANLVVVAVAGGGGGDGGGV